MQARLCALAVSAAGIAASAKAEVVFGLPITFTQNGTTVSAVFSVGNASWTGMLYRDDGTAGLGQFLFNNKSARPGDTRSLGTFNTGSELLFNYRVVTGVPAIYRGEDPAHVFHFGFEQLTATTIAVRIEDMPQGVSDRDWDDCVALLRFSKPVTLGGGGGGGGGGDGRDGESTPTPGSLVALLGGTSLFIGRRRR
jgi:hypothetical protein